MNKITNFFSKPFFSHKYTLFGLWALLGIVSAVTRLHSHNNFLIFRNVFWHAIEGKSLYAYYPEEYNDHNLYGPLFSVIIAPFALLPEWLGLILWCFALSMFLYWAISYLPKQKDEYGLTTSKVSNMQLFTLWFCAHELLTSLFMQQFNIAIAAIILLTFVFVEKGKDHWATLLIIIGTFVKIYGIVGLAFFFFSKNKLKFVASFLFWAAVCACLPIAITSLDYQHSQWIEWFSTLSDKNELNLLSGGQNISLMGIIRKIGYSASIGHEAFMPIIHGEEPVDTTNWWFSGFKDIWVICPAMLIFAISYFQINKWQSSEFRFKILAGILMFVVLFSTGSESCGYIIALLGCCIWYCVSSPRTRLEANINTALMVLAFIVTSLSPSDLFPRYLRYYWIQPYALKALPVALIWFKLNYELIFQSQIISPKRT